jgi:hypothetical protein
MDSVRDVVARGSLSVFLGETRVRVGEVDLLKPLNQVSNSPDLYGEIRLNDNFFRFVKRSSRVYVGVWAFVDSISPSEVNADVESVPAV